MSTWRERLRWIERFQHNVRVKVVLSILIVVAAIVVVVPIHQAASEFGSARRAVATALTDASLARNDPAAIELRDHGTVTVGDRVHGGDFVRRFGGMLFAASGEIANPGMVAELVMAPERPERIPAFLLDRATTAWMTIALAAIWLLVIVWLGVGVPFLLVLAGTGLVCLPFWLANATSMVVTVAGIGLLAFSFVVMVRLAILLLSAPIQVFAVAQTTIREATRTGVSLGFIALLLLLLPMVPLWIDDAQPLRYQVQTFISRSLNITYVISAAMTLLLACATVAFEIRDRQIWQLMTKPVSRLSYLIGKFIGVATLNLILLTICGISIFIFVQEMRTRPASDPLDAQSVRDEVLVARSGTTADYSPLSREELIGRIDDEIRNDPMLQAELLAGERSDLAVRREIAQRHQTEHLALQRQVPPGESRDFRFTGLSRGRALDAPVTLRYLFYAGRSDSHETVPVLFEFEGHDLIFYRQFVPAQGHVLTVPSSVINADGEVRLKIWNLGAISPDSPDGETTFFPGPYTIFFDASDLEVLYRVGGFEWNFFRAMIAFWIKLAFLAMLGVCCATFLSFAVACILSFTVFVVGSLGPFIAESLEYWYVEAPWRVDQVAAMWISTAAEWTLRAFGTVRPTDALVEGRLIAVGDIFLSLTTIGILWCGAALLAGWMIFSRRELATYSGQG